MKCPTAKLSMHLSDISVIISHVLESHTVDSTLFPAFLSMIQAANDEELILEILENVVLNLWLWISNNQTHCLRILRQLTNFLSVFTFPRENDLFSEFLVQSHLFEHSGGAFPTFRSLALKVLDLLPLPVSNLPVFVQLLFELEDEQQIGDYLALLSRKRITVPLDSLFAICDLVETCSTDFASQILPVVTVITLERLPVYELCLTRLALKWKDNTLYSLVPDDVGVFCINFLRQGPTKISKTTPEIRKGSTVSYFWLIFLALKRDPSQFELIPLSLANLDFESLVSNFDAILRTLAIFRATRAFDRVGQFTY
jgi:hypothetical protein